MKKLYILLFCIGCVVAGEQKHKTSVVFSQGSAGLQPLTHVLPETFVIGYWSYTVDAPGLEPDVRVFFNHDPGVPITRDHFIEQFDRCRKQKRFIRAEITITVKEGICSGSAHFISGTIIERIDIAGTLIGKDKYRHSYTLRPGDLFDSEAHAAGLTKIKKMLYEEGYLRPVVSDVLTRYAPMNTACLVIRLEQGESYRIGKTSILFPDVSDAMEELEARKIKRALCRSFRSSLEKVTYTTSGINQAIAGLRSLLQSHGFLAPTIRLTERIDHTRCAVDLHLDIAWGPRNLFLWYGNSFFSRTELLNHLLNFGSSLTFIPPPLVAEELVALYKQHGFWDVAITWRNDKPRTYFFINEGRPIVIEDITFEGVEACSSQDLIKFYGSSLIKEPFSAVKVTQFLSQLTEHYLHAGFWDVAIEHYEYVPVHENCYTLKIKVHEGRQRWLLAVESDIIHPIKNLPKPFDIRIIQEQRQVLLRTLRRQGKLYANPIPELREDTPCNLIVHWKYEGIVDPVAFGKTIVTGNGSLPTSYILRECCYEEGTLWNNDRLNATISRLRSLGIFDVVALVPDDIIAPAITKDVVLQCVPDALYEIRTRCGFQGVNRNVVQWNGGASPKIGLSFLARNPAGVCDLFRADVDYTRYMHDVVMSYKVPWIRNTRVGLELQAISSRYDQPVYIGSPQVLYRASHDGLLAGIGRTYGVLSGGLSLSVAQVGIKATSCDSCALGSFSCDRMCVIARSLDVSPLLLTTKPWYIVLEGTSMVDCRDDKVNPHEGSLTVLALKGVVPPSLSSGSFIKGVLEHSWFVSLQDWVLGMRFRIGMLGGAHFDRIMPMERFYLGGPYSLRCYYSDYAPPLAAFVTCKGCTCLVPTGGKYMINMNAEVRFPLYKQLVGGVVFIDAGSLSCASPYTLVNAHNLMGAIGVGLRINTPVGPVRGDIGWRLHHDFSTTGTKLISRSFAWFITLGHAF